MHSFHRRAVFVMPQCRHDHIRAVHKQAWTLASAGYEVVLLVADGERQEYLGMTVVTVRAPFRSLLRPLLNLPMLLWQSLRQRGDVYVLRNPDTIPLALLLRVFGRKVVYDSQEDFSRRPLIRDRLPRWLRPAMAKFITAAERLVARVASGVIVTQAQQPAALGGNVLLQANAPLISGPIVEAAERIELPPEDATAFIYVGELTRRRGVLKYLDMIERINRHCRAELTLVGSFIPAELRAEAMQHPGWQYVRYTGLVPHAEALARIRHADIGLAVLDAVADYPTSSITKLYEYMQFGKPFVASDFAAWQVGSAAARPGIYVDPASADELFLAARRLLDDAELCRTMGAIGRQYVAAQFNWDLQAAALVAFVGELFEQPAVSGECVP